MCSFSINLNAFLTPSGTTSLNSCPSYQYARLTPIELIFDVKKISAEGTSEFGIMSWNLIPIATSNDLSVTCFVGMILKHLPK